MLDREPESFVWTVYTVRPDQVRPTAAIFTDQPTAGEHAKELSLDPGVLASGVVQFTLNALGSRKNIALYVRGTLQKVPYVSDDRVILDGGRTR